MAQRADLFSWKDYLMGILLNLNNISFQQALNSEIYVGNSRIPAHPRGSLKKAFEM